MSKKNTTILDNYLSVTELMQQGVMWLSQSGQILGVNTRLAHELGYTKDTFAPTTIFEINPHTSYMSWKKTWEELLKKKEISIETQQITANETIYPVKMRGVLLEIEGKAICCGVIENLTQPNLLSQKVPAENRNLTQFSIDHAQEIIYWTDKKGRFIYANHQAVKVLGYSKSELLSLKITDIDTAVDEKKWTKIWTQLLQERRFEGESTHLKADGTELSVQINASLIDYNNQLINCVYVFDLSNKKKRDKQLELFGVTANSATDMVFWVDSNAKILFANNTATKELGYTNQELLAGDIFRFVATYGKEAWPARWQKLKEKKNGFYEGLHRRKDKSVFPVEISATYCLYEDQEMMCVYARNITERKQRENRLEMALEKIKRLKEEYETENTILKEEIQEEKSFGDIISKSKKYRKVLEQVQQVADTDATVLILGETGTGKELLARAVHQLSGRDHRPIIKINCGSLPANLIESELFGHEKGAFTGAYQQKKGKFELADKGTIFLDEMGELPLDLQVQLLRVLQEGEFERVGGNETLKVDVRVIAATNRDLEKQVANGKFREDLFYRLNVFPIQNLPLRERMGDVPLLVTHFVRRFSEKMGKQIEEIPTGLMAKLMTYDFPGNIRELENMIERAVILSKGKSLKLDSMIFKEKEKAINKQRFRTLQEMQRDHILDALRRTGGRVSGNEGAANLLKINDKTLVSRMKKLGIEKEDYA